MGKRSNFERIERDFYPTPLEAVKPLIPHIYRNHKYFAEPCAGDLTLVKHLESFGLDCIRAFDIDPRATTVVKKDALRIDDLYILEAACIITNPPWSRDVLHPMIEHFRNLRPTWLLFDADWMHTKQASPYLKYCRKIVSIGRVKWIPDSKHTGKDNCAWYFFDREPQETIFYGR